MKLASLRLRLLAAAAIALFLALALAWLGLTWLFERHVERREAAALIRSAEVLVSGLRIRPDGIPVADALPDDRRFERLASGLYWQLSTAKGVQRSSSLWDQKLAPPRHATPNGRTTRSMARSVTGCWSSTGSSALDRRGPAVMVQVAENDNDIAIAEREFSRELAVSLLLLWIVLSAAAWAQVQLGLRPLARISDQMERLRRNPAARLPDDYPTEIGPLAQAINALADARGSDLARARSRAADLAHSLEDTARRARRPRPAVRGPPEPTMQPMAWSAPSLLWGRRWRAELARSRAAAARVPPSSPTPILTRWSRG